ncbi:hypothetical protein B0H67DRAFT_605720 [Lasiosphaeris hirsuta]|uniref:Nephrocystin 3-like N-terminal domain-containing protein n=1 Tax=Lasiosphaeris hirsuta TaxID=260670 RepID=A0AA40E796_9PEZI|nr:hypothetical protein B0H67DRAFT_605720 [Lasiosphaeris hirsuta]
MSGLLPGRAATGEYEVVEFMDNLSGTVHPALTWGPVWDQKTGRWLQRRPEPSAAPDYPSIYREGIDARNTLIEMSNRYLTKAKRSPIDTFCSDDWRTVRVSMDKACLALDQAAARDKDVSGFTGKIKQGFHALCNNAGAGKFFTAMIPNDLGFSAPLIGGLNVVFAALEQTGFHREAVYKALERLPRILDNYDGFVETAAEDEEMHRRTAKLYAEVCLTLAHILNWFMMNSFVAGAKRLLNPSGFTSKLGDRMAEVEMAAQGFKVYAAILMLRKQDEMFQLQGWTAQQNERQFQEVRSELSRFVERADLFGSAQARAFEGLHQFLQCAMQKMNMKHTLTTQSTRLLQSQKPRVTAKKVLNTLRYDRGLLFNDIQDLLQLGSLPIGGSRLDMNRVSNLQADPRLRAWLTVDGSSLLLLNGGTDPLSVSTSFFSANIVSSLLEETQPSSRPMVVITLAYFCDRHSDYRDDAAGWPSELALSLLLQLIDRYPDFEVEDLKQTLEETNPRDVKSICASFSRLLRRLPATAVVFLVIDGLDSFTMPANRESQTRDIIEALVQVYNSLNSSQSPSPVLHFLVASPTRSTFVEDLFEEEDIIDMPPSLPPAHGYSIGFG